MPQPRIVRAVSAASVLCAVFTLAAPVAAESPGVTTLVSVSSAETQGNQDSIHAAITPDGRFVAFASLASNLVPGDTNDSADIFVRDRLRGTTERVSVGSLGQEGNGHSGVIGFRSKPAISASGRFVAFSSDATNLVEGDTNGVVDVFVRDRLTGTTTRVSVTSGGVQGDGFSYSPAISADGRVVAFQSDSTNLAVPNEPFPRYHIYVHDRLTGATERASVDNEGAPGDADSQFPDISPNGRVVAFVSPSLNLARGANGFRQVFVHDRTTGRTERVSQDGAGNPGDFDSDLPSLSFSGRLVAFVSNATNFVEDDTPIADVFVADRQAGTLERVTVDRHGRPANESSFEPAITSDGRFVAFSSFASNLVPHDDFTMDVFVRDRRERTTVKVSVNSRGEGGETASDLPAISDDGQVVAFESFSMNLVRHDDNTAKDVFVNDRGRDRNDDGDRN
jgi:Tol biopolymer transport system component